MSSVLSIDPGRKTGYSYWRDGSRIEGELSAERFLDFAHDLIAQSRVDHVACERFIISHQTGKYTQAPWSLEQIGAMRFMCHRHDVSFTLQNAADAKRFATDERLNAMGWRRPPGDGHARDAQRHLLLFLVKHDLIDSTELTRQLSK
jgi:hypothetical protein